MITPLRVFIVALILGIGTAVLLSWNVPTPPEESVAAIPLAGQTVTASTQPAVALANGKRQVTADNLLIIDMTEGSGPAVQEGDTVSVNYIGKLYYGGKQFDASADHGKPLDFTVGAGQMIKGVDEGVVGMKLGGKRELVIPALLAYGSRGAGNGTIPPDATLVFDLDLVNVVPAAAPQKMSSPQ